MDHGQLYNFLNYLRRKDAIGDTINGEEYNNIAEIAAYKIFKKYMGLPEQYQKGARDPLFGYGLNNIMEEKIRPLKVYGHSLTIDASGLSDYPVNYFRRSACYYNYTGTVPRKITVPFVNDAKFNERLTTVLDPPSVTDPVANLSATKIRFLPVGLLSATLEYIKFPTKPVMGYVVDYDTGELIYVDKGAYCQIINPGTTGNVVTLTVGAVTLGSYTVLANDTAEEVMIGLTADINTEILSHNVKAVYDGTKVVLIDSVGTYTTLTATPTGSITLNKDNFTQWSTQFDWENDVEAMNDISEIMLDMMGISNRDTNLIEWAEKEKVNS